MMYHVPGYGMRWLTTQHPACEFHAGDIKTMRKYLKMLHKQGIFRFVDECEIYHAEDQDCAGFCVEESYGCGNTAGMIEDITARMRNTDVGKNTPFNLTQVDMMRMRILMINVENNHYGGHRAVPSDCVFDMRCKIEEGRCSDEKETMNEVKHKCLSSANRHKYKLKN